MHPSLGPILLLFAVLPFILYIHFMPRWHQFLSQFLLPGVENKTEFDFIVIGSGSAGSVVAGRLAEKGHQVLLLEAGGPANYFMSIPALVALFQQTPYDWEYKTEPQAEGKFGLLQGNFLKNILNTI